MNPSTFVYKFEPGSASPALLLLHGSGGDENALLDLGRKIAPEAALLAPCGNVLEKGKRRFYRQLRQSVPDEEDVRRRAHELAEFVQETLTQRGLASLVAVGFSDGASLAAAVLLLRPAVLAAAILIRPMVPLRKQPMTDLSGKRVLLLSGSADLVVSGDNSARLAKMMTAAGAEVEHEAVCAGHEITTRDVLLTKFFVEKLRDANGALDPGSDAAQP